jgi:hypothetical protein
MGGNFAFAGYGLDLRCHLMAIKTVSEKRYAEKSQENNGGKIF